MRWIHSPVLISLKLNPDRSLIIILNIRFVLKIIMKKFTKYFLNFILPLIWNFCRKFFQNILYQIVTKKVRKIDPFPPLVNYVYKLTLELQFFYCVCDKYCYISELVIQEFLLDDVREWKYSVCYLFHFLWCFSF